MTNPVERTEEEVDASLTREIPWSVGSWSHFPAGVAERGGELLVTAVEGSDAWLHTEYGFVHDSEHALLAPFAVGEAVEVSFRAELHEQFDQAACSSASTTTAGSRPEWSSPMARCSSALW